MLLRELYEAPGKTATLAFGRLNPPTIGHAKLVDAITAQEGDHYLFLSQTQKPKTDPLDFATKIKFAKQFFPGVNIGHQAVKTPVQALEQLQSLGYTDIIFIAGSDRVDGFQKLFDTYNGQPDKTGKVPFKFNSIRVVSAGERDPDADGAEGMSASKMRVAAASGNLEAFAQGVPDKKLAKTMYDAVRNSMGVKDAVSTEGVDEAANKGLYYNVNKRKKAGTSRDANSPKAPTAQAWKDAAKTAKKESVAEAQLDEPTGMNQGPAKRDTPQRKKPTFAELIKKSDDKRSILQRQKDGGKKNWFAEGDSNSMATTAGRLANKDDGKVAKLRAAGDKRREDQLKSRNIAKKNEDAAGVAEHKGVKHKYQMTHSDGSKMKFTAKDDADARRQAKEHDATRLTKQQNKKKSS